MKKLRNMNLAIIILLELMILLTGAKLQNKIESGKVFYIKIFDKNAEMSEFGYLSDGQ